MKILLVSPHFFPEDFKCNDMAFELARRGHDVTVLSDIPNYPKGKFFDGYGIFKRRCEMVNGVKVIRALVIPRGKGGAIRLALNYMSFAFFASIIAVYLALFKRYDAVLVHETSPITVGIPAVIVKKIQRIPLYFWVLDLWPESLTAAGGINNKYIIGIFTAITRWIYRNSAKILISSKGFRHSITQKGNFGDKIIYFPNWVDSALCQKSEFELPTLPEGFIVMFAGNIGEAQDFDNIMRAANILKGRTEIQFVIVGDGRKRQWVDEYILKNGLSSTVHCVGRYPLAAMPSFFERADAMLVTLKDEPIFNLTVPAKVQAYMSAGKPIIAMLNGEGAGLIEEVGCGHSVAAGDAEALADVILKLSQSDRNSLRQMGERGREYSQTHFDFQKCIDNLIDIIS